MRKSRPKTTPRRVAPAEERSLRQALESAGWRFTRQRAAVCHYLQSVHTHPTAEEVYNEVRRDIANISLATVYKSLEALVECQLAAKLCFGDGPARYDCRSDHHYHLRCLSSGQVRDLPTPHDPSLISKLDPDLVENLRQQGFEVTGYRLELLGRFTGSTSKS